MKSVKTGLWIVAASCLLVQILSATPVAVLLEQGIYTEETVGDLPRAIEIYSEIVADDQANRKVVAEALFRLGRCHAASGDSKAALAELEKLVDQYPDQDRLVDQANRLITELTPKPMFPELDGCRLIYPVVLNLNADKDAPNTQNFTFYQTDKIQLSAQMDPSLEDKLERFEFVQMRVEDDGTVTEFPAQHFPGVLRPKPPEFLDTMAPGLYRYQLTAYQGSNALAQVKGRFEIRPALNAQIGMNDIQANGDIRFVGVQQTPNVPEEMATRRFINSDFVHIESMFDANGDNVEFTEKHEGNHYRYLATLNKPVPPGGTLFLGSQGWEESLVTRMGDDTYRYRMNHTPGGSSPVRRVEIFRLPKGAELLEATPADLPHRVREDGRVELLVDTVIPANGSLLTEFRYRLEGEGGAGETASLEIGPEPWVSGDALRYRLLTKSGVEAGTLIWTVNEVAEGWKIEQRLVVPSSGAIMASQVIADRKDFTPIRGRTKHQLGTVDAEYKPGKVLLHYAGSDNPREVEVSGPIYDNEQVLFLMRRLPFAEGYEARFPIMSVLSGTPGLECRIRVMNREPLEGRDCWKIRIQVYMGAMKAVEQTAWFTVDGHVPVRFVTDQMDMELAEQINAGESPVQMELKQNGAVLYLPEGWFGYELPSPGKDSEIVRLLPPEMKLEAMLCKAVRQPAMIGIRDIVEKDVEVLKGYFKNYSVREGSIAEKEINGKPAVVFVADYEDQGNAKVEFRAYYVAGSRVFWFVFRMDADKFDSSKAELDQLIAGLKILK